MSIAAGDLERLSNELEDLLGENDRLRSEIGVKDGNIGELEAQMDGMGEDLASAQDWAGEMTGKMKSLGAKNEALETEIKKGREDAEVFLGENEKLCDQLKTLEGEFLEKESGYKREIDRMEDTLQEYLHSNDKQRRN